MDKYAALSKVTALQESLTQLNNAIVVGLPQAEIMQIAVQHSIQLSELIANINSDNFQVIVQEQADWGNDSNWFSDTEMLQQRAGKEKLAVLERHQKIQELHSWVRAQILMEYSSYVIPEMLTAPVVAEATMLYSKSTRRNCESKGWPRAHDLKFHRAVYTLLLDAAKGLDYDLTAAYNSYSITTRQQATYLEYLHEVRNISKDPGHLYTEIYNKLNSLNTEMLNNRQ